MFNRQIWLVGEAGYRTSWEWFRFHFVKDFDYIFYWTFLNNWNDQSFCTKLALLPSLYEFLRAEPSTWIPSNTVFTMLRSTASEGSPTATTRPPARTRNFYRLVEGHRNSCYDSRVSSTIVFLWSIPGTSSTSWPISWWQSLHQLSFCHSNLSAADINSDDMSVEDFLSILNSRFLVHQLHR